MAKIVNKLDVFKNALTTLDASISLFKEYEKKAAEGNEGDEAIFLATRDSMIQRFEYCTDLFWKVLKFYLQEVERVEVPVMTPRGVIRDAVAAKVITEFESDVAMLMIKKRNETSHIYHEDIAQSIAENIPEFYSLMHTIAENLSKKVRNA